MRKELKRKLAAIELLLLDVDGVLTDGSITYDDNGIEAKAFNVKDGLGIRLLQKQGIQVGIVTGRSGRALQHRCRDLKITLIYDGVRDKAAVLEIICETTGVSPEAMAYVGDDIFDLPLQRRVGLAVAVADAHPVVKIKADLVTAEIGGRGAVREICEAILKAKGLWDQVLAQY